MDPQHVPTVNRTPAVSDSTDKPTMGSRGVLLPSLDWGECRIDVVLTSRLLSWIIYQKETIK